MLCLGKGLRRFFVSAFIIDQKNTPSTLLDQIYIGVSTEEIAPIRFESAYINRMSKIPSMRPKIDLVAKRAGVSTATVSRVLNKPDTVRDTLRKKVLDAVTELGYVPHAGARALMLQRSGTIGAVFPTIDNAIFSQAIDALQRRLTQEDFQLLVATSGFDPEAERKQVLNLVARGVDALVLCGFSQSTKLLRFINQQGLACVHVMVHPGRKGSLSVGFDNAAAMRQVTRYLLDLGHRRIAMLAGVTRHNDRALQRLEGVREALQSENISMPDNFLVECPYTLDKAREGMRSLMRQKSRPTAVICGNDVLAFGALLEASHLGMRVPQDVSLVGFDDLEMAKHLQPALTTVRVPTEHMWSLAAERLLASLRNENVQSQTEVDIALVVRQSCGPPHTKDSSR